MSYTAVNEALDYLNGIASTADINRELKKRGHSREAGKTLNTMKSCGEVEMIDSCVVGQIGGKVRIWIKYYESEIRL